MNKEQELQQDLLVTALEGGSNYWYHIPHIPKSILGMRSGSMAERIMVYILGGGTLGVFDLEDEEEKLGELSLETIERGEELMAAEEPEHWENIQSGDWDAETADVWLQFIVMGEIVFG